MLRTIVDSCTGLPFSFVFLAVAAAATFAASTAQAETFLYVSQAPEQAIRVYKMNDADGALTEVDSVAVDGAPGASSVDPTGKFLFVSLRSTFQIASFKIDPATGKLTLINTTKLDDGKNAAYVRTDRTGRFLFSASYLGGRVVVHAVDAEGRISAEPLQVIETDKTAHCVAVDAANVNVYVPHVAPNLIYGFQLDAATGRLTLKTRSKGGDSIRPGVPAGPRHLAFHPRGFAFTSDETGSSVTMYLPLLGVGLVKQGKSLSTLPEGYTDKNTTAEVKVHPSGKFIWVSNRGHDSLAGFAFTGDDAATYRLKPLGQTPTEKTPRSFDIEPSGRFLFAAGEGSGNLQAYEINQQTGALTPTKKYEVGKSLTWVTAVKL
jgi:6-phosphogluconolactonase